ncbi:hypothetical protein K438DRAFT_1748501 [Mycena galopus ATCC 62051]|nr:hypothetical protein K438DRAFT_1748501 [Mycena galopus ATCC 62051]
MLEYLAGISWAKISASIPLCFCANESSARRVAWVAHLGDLLSIPFIERVYAFNRRGRTSVSERQKEAFVDRALDVTLLASEKLVYLEDDTSKADLGLPLDTWNAGIEKILMHRNPAAEGNPTRIYENMYSWKGAKTRNLIDLARQSPKESGVRFLFTSSIDSALGWGQNLGPFPDQLQPNSNIGVGVGIAGADMFTDVQAFSSAHASAEISCLDLDLAASGLVATSFRIGQICGSLTNGVWAAGDCVPAIVKISHAIIDAVLSAEKPPFVVNLVLGNRTGWLPAPDATVSKAGTTEFSMLKAQVISKSMKVLNPLNEDDVKQWMHYWREKRFNV